MIDQIKNDHKVGRDCPHCIIVLTSTFSNIPPNISNNIYSVSKNTNIWTNFVVFSPLMNLLDHCSVQKGFILSSFKQLDAILPDLFRENYVEVDKPLLSKEKETSPVGSELNSLVQGEFVPITQPKKHSIKKSHPYISEFCDFNNGMIEEEVLIKEIPWGSDFSCPSCNVSF